jgi:uncharacterized YokU family protein
MQCNWCEEDAAQTVAKTGYWELPDGTRAIQIDEIPSLECANCGMVYQDDKVIEEVEDQMYLIDTTKLGNIITFKELMDQPRLLKRNYFKF